MYNLISIKQLKSLSKEQLQEFCTEVANTTKVQTPKDIKGIKKDDLIVQLINAESEVYEKQTHEENHITANNIKKAYSKITGYVF